MTDQPSSNSQPSMEDILASIRRIIDDDEGAGSTPAAAAQPVVKASEPAPYSIDEDAAELARAEYDEALSRASVAVEVPDPADETIFPQRDGALWRRVAGHELSEGETDPLPADDTLELTEMLDEDDAAMELTELVDSAGEDAAGDTDRVLEEMLAEAPETPDVSGSGASIHTLGIGAMTAAGIGAAGAAGGSAMDRITGSFSGARSTNEDDEVLDLTRSVESEESIESLASAMDGNDRYEDDDLPTPVFERVDVEPLEDTSTGNQEGELDRSFETVAVTGLDDDYSESFAGGGDKGDDRERVLDERFYESDDFSEMPPEIGGDYAASLGGDAVRSRQEGAPTEDEMETVGGLVRDALRSRLPATQQSQSAPDSLVSGGAEESAAKSLASLARYDAHAPRRIYGGIKITDDEDSATIEGMVQDTLRPMLREWLNDNLPTLVESMVKQEVDRISARSRQFVRDDPD